MQVGHPGSDVRQDAPEKDPRSAMSRTEAGDNGPHERISSAVCGSAVFSRDPLGGQRHPGLLPPRGVSLQLQQGFSIDSAAVSRDSTLPRVSLQLQ